MNRFSLYNKIYSIVGSSTILFLLSACGSSSSVNTPSDISCDIIIDKNYYTICYDYTLKGARSVTYSLDTNQVNLLNIEKREDFYIEESIPKPYRSRYSDYTGSGYDRGHLASDASFDWSEESLKSVYSMANIVPQEPDLNRYSWIDTEKLEREKAKEFKKVQVKIIVNYSDNPMQIGENAISVPRGFYKSISNKDFNYEECFYYENIPYNISTDTIDEHKIECSTVP